MLCEGITFHPKVVSGRYRYMQGRIGGFRMAAQGTDEYMWRLNVQELLGHEHDHRAKLADFCALGGIQSGKVDTSPAQFHPCHQ